MPKNSQAKIKANGKYDQKAYDKATIRFKKGIIDLVKAHCKAKNQSFNDFVVSAALDRMQADQAQGIGVEGVDQDAGSRADQRGE